MDVKKCDRCNTYYDKNEGVEQINGHFVRYMNICTNISQHRYDLCDSCIEDLYKFMNLV